jgi:hypothetical protein
MGDGMMGWQAAAAITMQLANGAGVIGEEGVRRCEGGGCRRHAHAHRTLLSAAVAAAVLVVVVVVVVVVVINVVNVHVHSKAARPRRRRHMPPCLAVWPCGHGQRCCESPGGCVQVVQVVQGAQVAAAVPA